MRILKEVLEFCEKGANLQKDSKGDILYIPSGAVFPEGVKPEKCYTVLSTTTKIKSDYLLKKNDVLFNTGGVGTLGRVGFYDFDSNAVCDPFVLMLRGKKNILDNRYLFYQLQSREIKDLILKNTVGSTGITSIKKSDILTFPINLPPLPIQKRIAEILDAADALRRKDLELLRKYDELAQAIFIDMFGDPVKNEKGWEVKEFGDYINVLTDYHSNGSYETLRGHVQLKTKPDYALMVRTTDLEKNNFDDDVNYITKEAYEHLEKSKVFGGEIIINKIGSAGKVYLMPYLNRPVSLGMNSFLLRLNNKMNPVFAYYFLTSQFGEYEISKRVFGAVTKTITKDAVRSIPMFDIPLDLQNKYVSMIEKINLMKTKRNVDYSKTLFDSLLQQAFKGELVK